MGVPKTLSIPPQNVAITERHAVIVQAHQTCLQRKVANRLDQQAAILAAIVAGPMDRAILREKMEVKDELSKAQFEITEKIEVLLMLDEKAERSNIYRIYQQDEQRLINNWGKMYALTLSQ